MNLREVNEEVFANLMETAEVLSQTDMGAALAVEVVQNDQKMILISTTSGTYAIIEP